MMLDFASVAGQSWSVAARVAEPASILHGNFAGAVVSNSAIHPRDLSRELRPVTRSDAT